MSTSAESSQFSLKILVVEDDVVTRNLLELALRNLGHEVTSCAEGHEAWHRFKANPAQVVVSDWDMPEMDGLELCEHIRSSDLNSYPYFIMVTAKSSIEDYARAMDAGVDDFLSKPLDQRELAIRLRVARRILGFHKAIDRLQEVIPFCSYCNKVRRDDAYWDKLERFLEDNTGSLVSHSICPDCYEKVLKPQLDEINGG